jgi:hypothetical protein
MSPQEQRKLDRVSNDVDAIYELLGGIQGGQRDHTLRLERLEGRFDAVDGRLDGIDGRLDGIDGHLANLSGNVEEILRRLAS